MNDKQTSKTLEAVLETVHDGIISIDSRGIVIFTNPAAERIFGYSAGEIVGQNVKILMPEPYSSEHDGYMSRYQSGGKAAIIGIGREAEGLRKDGAIFPIRIAVTETEVEGEKIYVGAIQDQTEEKRAEIALRENGELYKGIIERNFDAIVILDLDGLITYVSPALQRLIGFMPEEVLGRPFHDFVQASGISEAQKAFSEAAHGIPIQNLELCILKKDGQPGFIEVNATPFILDGEVEGVQAIFRDITERKIQETEIQQKTELLQKSLESEKRYSALQREFITLASHEFRTPLAVIDGAAQRIIRKQDSITPDQLQERVERIRGAVEIMIDLIDTTLSSSNFEAGKIEMKPAPIDFRALLNNICAHEAGIFPSYDLRVDLDGLPEGINADWRLLEQVFTHLLSNALKYTPDTTVIEVTGWTKNEHALVSVRDYGVGISKDDVPRLFERFFRGETSIGIPGTGLGLSVCKKIIDMHGGSIEADSAEGEGTTFTVQLPIGSETLRI